MAVVKVVGTKETDIKLVEQYAKQIKAKYDKQGEKCKVFLVVDGKETEV